MIIRTTDDSQVFITQPDHARLAAEAIANWHDDGFDDNPRRASILLAAREHDNGWREEDSLTHVDANGKALDFICVPIEVRHRIWPRAVDRLGEQDPYAAALVAQHALTVYGHYESDMAWDPFFEIMRERCAAQLARSDAGMAGHLLGDYRFVHAADRISLAFCTGWPQPLESYGHRIILRDDTVEVISGSLLRRAHSAPHSRATAARIASMPRQPTCGRRSMTRPSKSSKARPGGPH